MMAEYSTEDRNGRLRTELKLAPGEKVSLCRCMKSADFPFCDGTHKTCEGNAGPLIVSVLQEERKPD
jgi:CDGSH-type Zn-finger protein